MNYAILRVQKLKTNTEVRGSLRHAFRAQSTPNADPSREHENTHLGADSVDDAMKAYKARLPDKVRKNGVRCIEYLMTASPEKMNELSRDKQDAYFEDALEWLKEKHGAENVVYSGIHRDETTPHMYAYVVPLSQEKDQDGKLVKPGKLNCREFLGGSKHVLSDLQTEFAENIGKKHGLDRGIKGSKAKHQSIQRYYSKLNNQILTADKIKQPEKEVHSGAGVIGKFKAKAKNMMEAYESKDEIIDRLANQTAGLLSQVEEAKRFKKEAHDTFSNLNGRLKEMEPVQNLSRDDKEKLLLEAKKTKAKRDAENRQAAEERRQRNKDRGR